MFLFRWVLGLFEGNTEEKQMGGGCLPPPGASHGGPQLCTHGAACGGCLVAHLVTELWAGGENHLASLLRAANSISIAGVVGIK